MREHPVCGWSNRLEGMYYRLYSDMMCNVLLASLTVLVYGLNSLLEFKVTAKGFNLNDTNFKGPPAMSHHRGDLTLV